MLERIAQSLGIKYSKVAATAELLDAGNTIPFIARYRKESTGELDEMQLRSIADSLDRERELESRKSTILKTIDEQGQLTEHLKSRITDCFDKAELEAIYLPFKPKRRTRATTARERGLEPLAKILADQQPLAKPRNQLLDDYVAPDKDVPDREAALQGACDIVAEWWAENEEAIEIVRSNVDFGSVCSSVKRGKKDPESKFSAYFDCQESYRRIPSHRFLAMKRGEAEGVLKVFLTLDDERIQRSLKGLLVTNPRFEFRSSLLTTAEDTYKRLIHPAIESSALSSLKEKADEEAIVVFARNLRDLLMAPPAGQSVTLGVDPGFRTGCKLAVVDETGSYLATKTIYPTPPRNDVSGAEETLLALIAAHDIQMIAIGNGTASRETEAFVSEVIKRNELKLTKVVVSESGASIYSASELAIKEYPQLDVTVRGAISIAHRLQDPLAELVKIDPKSIGVGQYQHDVDQGQLKRALNREVESCVTSVGVELNQASSALLSHVSGVGPKLADRIVEYREHQGAFKKRSDLLKVPKLGPKAYEQAAGFLRISSGPQPLDNSAVHPESYGFVKSLADRLGRTSKEMIGNVDLVSSLNPQDFVTSEVGLPTVRDILDELAKPGRDPRREFRVAKFSEKVQSMDDLKEGQVLEGSITNVTRFGAFVDIGVHQDGLIHISELANQFVNDPADVVAVGDIVRVKVLEVDKTRKRIGLSRKQLLSS